MEVKNFMKILKQLIVVIIGVAFIGMGAAISVINNLGSDPITVFAQGISCSLLKYNLNFFTVGNSLILVDFLVFVVLVFLYKLKYVKFGTFVGMVFIGLFIDIWQNLLLDLVKTDSTIGKIIWMLIGATILSVGIGIYISADMGAAPVDLIPVEISEHLHINYSLVRVICDLLFMLFGWLLGGVVGIATIVCMCLIGPISGLIIKHMKKYILINC